jgi:hypothetical protein
LFSAARALTPSNGATTTGLVLGAVLIGGRKRLVMLQATGEIWPVSENDVAFIMPPSLVAAGTVDKCWTPELLQLWASGKEMGLSEPGAEEAIIGPQQAEDMFVARRQVATLLRKIGRETERMAARLMSGSIAHGRGGGMEAVWEQFAPEEVDVRGGASAAEVAEFLLNTPGTTDEQRVRVKPSTLPAFAASSLLMARSDLFIIDERNMHKSRFMVRSRAERKRIERVKLAVESESEAFTAFIAKAEAVREALEKNTPPPEWSDADLDMIWVLTLPFVETRSSQAFTANPIVARIVKSFGLQKPQMTDMRRTYAADVTAPLLEAIGVLPPSDSLRTSLLSEQASRSMAIAGVRPEPITQDLNVPTAADAALDHLRTDFSHRVYVIDDADAKELDDGIALEPTPEGDYWIHVHVADPTRFVDRDGALATQASFAGSSTYFPEGTTPLLPPGLGGGERALSLGESDAPQSVMVFSARVNTAGEMLDYKVQLGSLPAAVLTTYATVNDALGMAPNPVTRPLDLVTPQAQPSARKHTNLTPDDITALGTLRDLANAVRAQRFATSGLEWQWPTGTAVPLHAPPPLRNLFDRASYSPTPRAHPAVEYDYVVTHRAPTVSAENTVAELMILANRVVARFCADHSLPVPYRGSDPLKVTSATPRGTTIESLLAAREPGSGYIDPLTFIAANLTLSEGTLGAAPLPHWIMGVDSYVRATSPLRRFDDMLVHWQIKSVLGGTVPLGAAAVLELAERADGGMKRIRLSQRTANKFFTAGLLLQNPTRVSAQVDLCNLEAVVCGPTERGRVAVFVPALGLISDMHFPGEMPELPIGTALRARVLPEVTWQWPNPMINFAPV